MFLILLGAGSAWFLFGSEFGRFTIPSVQKFEHPPQIRDGCVIEMDWLCGTIAGVSPAIVLFGMGKGHGFPHLRSAEKPSTM